mgnify:CR=1 FL=1
MKKKNKPREARTSNSQGTGFYVSKEGHIVTNHHVIDDAKEIIVQLYNDEEYRRKMASQGLQDYVDLYHPYDKVIILGDLNDEITDPEAQNVFWNFISNPNEYQFADMSIAEGSSDDWSYPGWPSHLDHIIISNELFNFVYDVSCIKYEESLENGWSEYDNYISDHRPVGIQLYWINGCTDPEACNYDEAANTDDGSCLYQSEFYIPESMAIDPSLLDEAFDLPISLVNPQNIPIEGFQFVLEYDAEFINLNETSLHDNYTNYNIITNNNTS